MITRLFADNFRCLSNFEVKFAPLTIFLGPNGSGKSACLGLLSGLRDLILGRDTAAAIFPSESRTRWDMRLEQTFELGIRLPGGSYSYRLVVSHHDGLIPRRDKSPVNRIKEEILKLEGQVLYKANVDETRVYNDSGTGDGVQLLTDWQVSGISRVHERHDNRKLVAFRDFLWRMPVIALNPYAVKAATDEKLPIDLPSVDCCDFAGFLANLIVSDAQVMRPVEDALRDGSLSGLLAFEAPLYGDSRIVQCLFPRGKSSEVGGPVRFRLDELSSGQIGTVILQTVATFVEKHEGALVLDEPGNFLAVSEMQPFLTQLESLALEYGRQVVISTHHPLAIDFLAAGHGLWFERDPSGPTRSPVPLHVDASATADGAYLRVSDLIARGWLSGLGVEVHGSIH